LATIGLERVADGFTLPTGLVAPPDDSGRLFVLDLVGRIYVINANGELLDEPFLDISALLPPIGVDSGDGFVYDERGLLGLAFHPEFATNRRFFVYYSTPRDEDDPAEIDSETLLSEFLVRSDNPDLADDSSELPLLEINQPQSNHKGGPLAFGPDGYLYVGVGDGGSANDDGFGHTEGLGNGQDPSTLLGKILRIDVDGPLHFSIPPDNPFVNVAGTRREIYALGFRNPWKFSFDDEGRFFVADVGQDLFEEINIVTAGGNYGWRIREGLHCFDVERPSSPPANCPSVDADGAPLIDPIIEYPHTGSRQPFGISVIGGYVYRGDGIPCLNGDYVFGDWSTSFVDADGTLLAAREQQNGAWAVRELSVAGRADGRLGRYVLSLGVDSDGELYVLTAENFGPTGTTGAVDRIIPAK